MTWSGLQGVYFITEQPAFTELIFCDGRFIKMAQAMGMQDAKDPMDFIVMLAKLQQDRGVAGCSMSDYGITPEEFEQFANNAKDTMGALFSCDRCPLSVQDCVAIYRNSYA